MKRRPSSVRAGVSRARLAGSSAMELFPFRDRDAVAVTDGTTEVRAEALPRVLASMRARFTRELGLRPGDHVALLSRNRTEALLALIAGQVSGYVVTPVSHHLAKDELAYVLEDAKKEFTITRFKGLGEMNPEQLWETTMNAEARTLLQVKLEDAVAAEEIFTTLMGENVEDRRKFIEENALEAVNLDI